MTKGIPEEANGWEQLVYAPALNQSIMLSQYHQRNSEPNESLVGYDFDLNAWNLIDMGGNFHTETMPEGGESQGYFDFNPNNNTIIYHCCTTGSNQPENVNHTWWYDVLGQSGRDKHTSPKPPAPALQPGGAFDRAHNVFLFHGGDSYVGTWTYDPVANTWQQMHPTGTVPDPSLILPGVAYSSGEQKIYLFGGQSETTGAFSSDLYVYDYPTNSWALINPAGGVKPPARFRHGFAYDSTNNIFLAYGGQNGAGVLNDTWVYNPVANTWTQVTSSQPTSTGVAPFAKLSYDSDHNVFVLAQVGAAGGYFGGIWNAYAIQTWLFRYAGGGPDAGNQSANVTVPVGSLNRYNGGWGKDPVLASSGNSLYVGWAETGSPFDMSDAAWPHIYVSQYSGGNWTTLGTSFQSISGDLFEAHAPSLAVVGGQPWVSFYQSTNTGQTALVYGSSWDGVSTWTGGSVGLNGSGSPRYQGQSQIIAVGSVPHVALLEVDKTVYPQRTLAYVQAWSGSAWSAKGGALNQNTSPGSTALSVSIASDGSNPLVAWSEYLHTANQGTGYDTDSNPQIYVAQWNGSQWVTLGGSLNVNAANWAYDPSIAYVGGVPYVAWVERSQTGNAQLYVKTWNGSSWVAAAPGALNQAPGTGWAYHPSLTVDAATSNLYLGWVEQVALGQKAQVFVSRHANGSWTPLGGALNMDSVQGSAQRVSIGVFNGQPVAAWGEVNLGAMRQIYLKQWNGSTWTQLPGPGLAPDSTPPTMPQNPTATAVSANQINLAWQGSTDTVGVEGYLVYQNGIQVANVTSGITYQDTGLSPNTSYAYHIAAYDAAGNVSGQSATALATTLPSSVVTVSSVNLIPPSTVGGTPTTANTVALTGPAPSGGALVTLNSSDPNAIVPASLTVAAGGSVSPAFTITTTAVTANTPVTISATYNGVAKTAVLTVTPLPAVSAVTLTPTSVVGGGSTTLNTVTLNAPAPSGGAVVTLTSSNPSATVPASVTVAAGATVSPAFTITTGTVAANTPVTISATYNGVKAAVLTVTAVPRGSVLLAHASASASGTATATSPAINTTGATLLLMMAADYSSISTTDTHTDSMGNVWTPMQNCATGTNNITAWYVLNPATSSAHVFRVTGSYTSMAVMAFAGIATFQSPAICGISTGATLAPGPVTTATPSLLVTFISHAFQMPTVAGGFTLSDYEPYGSFEGISTAYQFQSAAGSSNPVWTNNAGQNYSGFLAVFAGASNQPTIASIFPASGVVGTTVPVTLNGTNFVSGATVGAGAGIAVSNVSVTSSTQMSATFTIAGNAPLGATNVSVTTSGGTSSPVSFTINPAPLSITGPASLSPATVGLAYGPVQFSATGGAGGNSWTATGLPAGLTLSSAGSLSGTPGAGSQGSYNPQFTVIDSSNTTASIALSLTVKPPAVSVATLSLSPASVVGGGSTTANTVTLNGPAPSGGAVVTLTSSDPSATVPASVTVAAGATVSPTFAITTTAVVANTPATISATYNGVKTAVLTVTPAAGDAGGPALISHASASARAKKAAVSPAIDTTGASLLVLMAADYNNDSTSDAHTDSEGNVWIPMQNCATGTNNITAWYAINPITGSNHTFRVQGSYTSLAVMAFSGVSSLQSISCQISSGSTLAAGPVTTTVPSLLVTFVSHASPTPAISSGFTITDFQPNGTSEGISAAYQVQSAAGPSNPVWTNNAGQNYSGFLLAIQ